MNLRHRGKYLNLAGDSEPKERVTSDLVLGKWILEYLKDYKFLVIIAITLILGSAVIGLVSPYINGVIIIDEAFGSDPTVTGNYRKLLMYCLALFGVAVVNAVINILKNIILYRIGYTSVSKIRTDTFTKLQSLSQKYYDTQEAGRIISKITNDCDKVNEIMSGGLITSLTDFITVICVTVILLVMNWELALLCLAFSIPPVLIVGYFLKVKARKAYRQTRRTIANVTANLSEGIDGVKVSQSFSREKRNIKDFQKVNLEDRQANIKVEAIFAIANPLLNLLSSGVVGFVYLYSGWTMYYSGITIHVPMTAGEAVTFVQYIGLFFTPLLNLTLFYNTFQSTMAATERIYQLNHTISDVSEKENAHALPKIAGKVRFENVRFAYIGDETIFDGFNLEVNPGESIAIVGPTGAGKTTLIKLLARFYEIQEGKITIDDYDIRDVTLKSLHGQMGIVLQDPYLFSGSIKDNIQYNRKNITQNQIEAAAKVVNAHEFIERMPSSYDTVVGERGGRLSQGQRQLISFARAILDDPRILILDEATSSVDPYTELLIKKALDNLLTNRTSFIIAHRLSTVRNANRIIVIKGGKIVEEGNNDDLLALKGEYYHLYQLQFKDQE